ncbi:hypothetical protein SAMN00017405_1048 [Desulfonispora thiosulfatigenes DSM 11270]|uniref:Type VI secretion system spike protein VgrG3-like C-terminal domain-containing protein n=1 Tax=Desulfonispora thiosulfatigenes DSM 11270 TaxID=656914 RepID=A0A1W1URZ7_DESTI|nr:hypothetical protein [Desulfonispora thiosulfatigenes]SMB83504.1 hypothetical protein SAMN00017405_1048 [Desulfonispora thiosulfatigenes DSM 11270]
MSVSTNEVNNLLVNSYNAKINSNSENNKDQVKVAESLMFQALLNQIIKEDSSDIVTNSLLTAFASLNNLDTESSLNAMHKVHQSGAIINPSAYTSRYKAHQTSSLGGLGSMSSKYESNLNPGAIANNPGDHGGKSYGAWQFSSKMGSLDSFINWLKNNHQDIYATLSSSKIKDGGKPGLNFDHAWSSIAKTDKSRFLKAQHDYVKYAFYEQAANSLKSRFGFDINQRSEALRESLFSTAVQHGVGGAVSIFSKLNLQKDDRTIISSLYNERQKVDIYFKSSSPQIKRSVYNRFTKEKIDALNMLDKGLG